MQRVVELARRKEVKGKTASGKQFNPGTLTGIHSAALRANRIHDLLADGKSVRQIKAWFKQNQQTSSSHIGILRGGFRKPPIFIPPKFIPNWSLARAKRVQATIDFTKKVIEGKAKVREKASRPLSAKAKAVIAALRRNPQRPALTIAKALGVSNWMVSKWRQRLVAQGEIPKLDLSKLSKSLRRDPRRVTKVLDKEAREKILEEKSDKIQRKANKIYSIYRAQFDAANLTPEGIADELRERLDWKLRTYNPKRIKFGSKEGKLTDYFNKHLSFLAADLIRDAKRKYRSIESLDAERRGGLALKEVLAAPAVTREIRLSDLERVSSRLNLNLLEEAVLFGLAAGIFEKEIGERIGLTEGRVSQIKTALEKRVASLLSK